MDGRRMLLLAGGVAVLLAGCAQMGKDGGPAAEGPSQVAQAAYTAFLSGDRALLGRDQEQTAWVPHFEDPSFSYEYTYLDLDGDGAPELLVQMEDDPCGYNGVFHFDGEKIRCWNSDFQEMSCRDVPLADGTMVRQYDYNGTRLYGIFSYRQDGERNELHTLFARDEAIPEDSGLPCPYYEVDGVALEEAEFERQLWELVGEKQLERSRWTPCQGPEEP